jgi:hypothetical protein
MEETKMRRILAFGVLLAAVSQPALAVNFSGKWAIQTDTGGEGRGRATILTLNQVGDEVTGTMVVPIEPWTNSPLNNTVWDGKVEENALSFYVWSGTDQPAKICYCGAISTSGDAIVFVVSHARDDESRGCSCSALPTLAGQRAAGGPGASGTQQMIARRVK